MGQGGPVCAVGSVIGDPQGRVGLHVYIFSSPGLYILSVNSMAMINAKREPCSRYWTHFLYKAYTEYSRYDPTLPRGRESHHI